MKAAHAKNMTVIALTGRDGGQMGEDAQARATST